MTQPPRVILIIEDDPAMAELLAARLPLAGYTAIITSTGTDAIQHLQHHPPDLILSDLAVAQGDGWAVYQHLRAQPQHQTRPCTLLTTAPLQPSRSTIRGCRS